jgi:tRNA nucleotidyltransferase/poly(A) polymerase
MGYRDINIDIIRSSKLLRELYIYSSSRKIRVYLVGGLIRDLFFNRGEEYYDFDFVVEGENVLSFSRTFADIIGGSFFVLNDKFGKSRIVIRRGGKNVTLDFNGIEGKNIEEDLSKRDFTINAIAVELGEFFKHGGVRFIDPFLGIDDINARIINIVSEDSFKADPLRMLRAFRLSALYELNITSLTKDLIVRDRKLIKRVSHERIRDEIFKIISIDKSYKYIKEMDEVGLLAEIIPEIKPAKDLEQNEYHHLDVWNHTLTSVKNLEQLINNLSDHFFPYEDIIIDYLNEEPVYGRPKKALLKLIALLHDIGKAATRSLDDNGFIHFYNHEIEGERISGNIGKRLKLSNDEVSIIKNMVRNHLIMEQMDYFQINRKHVERFFNRCKGDGIGTILLSLSDILSIKGPRSPKNRDEIAFIIANRLIKIYMEEIKPVYDNPPLIMGRDLIKEFNLKPGPIFKKILDHVRTRQLSGDIATREEALDEVSKIISKIEY